MYVSVGSTSSRFSTVTFTGPEGIGVPNLRKCVPEVCVKGQALTHTPPGVGGSLQKVASERLFEGDLGVGRQKKPRRRRDFF